MSKLLISVFFLLFGISLYGWIISVRGAPGLDIVIGETGSLFCFIGLFGLLTLLKK